MKKSRIVIEEIFVEREKQQSEWGNEHDDQEHCDGSISMAAACLASNKQIFIQQIIHHKTRYPIVQFSDPWPWDTGLDPYKKSYDTKRTRRDQLIIAAALIVSEIERIDRGFIKEEKEA